MVEKKKVEKKAKEAEKTTKKTEKIAKKAEKTTKKLDITKLPLEDQLKFKKSELEEAKKSLHDGTLQNPHAIKGIRKEVARILTKINQEKGVNRG